jgi:ATP-dependent DNA helicase PIF1
MNTQKIPDNTVKRIVLSTTDTNTDKSIAISNKLEISLLSTEQKYAYDKFTQGCNLFITGPGGTGKTQLIKYLLEYSNNHYRTTQICAMTGCAAVLLNCNARTLHSWSGIKLAKGPKHKIIESVLKNKKVVAQWRRTKCLILDEVSMLSCKIFNIIEEIARKVKKINIPFGGLQVVFTGDFYQLPPVGTSGEPDTEQFCFESPIWNTTFPDQNIIQLTTIFRQNDAEYIKILNQVRIGQLNTENTKILEKYLKRTYDPALHNNCIPTKLFPLRAKTDYVNSMMFSKIQQTEFVFSVIKKNDCYTHIESNRPISFEMRQKCDRMSSAEIEYELDVMVNNSPCINILRLKKGCAIMCTINLDMDNGICNGSQGIVTDIIQTDNRTIPVVQFANGIIKHIDIHYWQSEDFPALAIGQYPLCLAWALTIHKIQGATLDMAEIDIGQSIFEYGQTYVALSRVQSLNGLYLSAFQPQKILANPIVHSFYASIPDNTYSNTIFSLEQFELKEETYDDTTTVKKVSLN